MLGLQVITNTPELKSQYGLGVSDGAVVVAISNGSSADQAGLKLGDVIVGFNSQRVTSSEDLEADVQSSPVGKTVTLRIWRESDQMTLTAVLQASTAAN